ncbi:hypothetical protein ACPA54_32060 [Uniformispora flossi]|uniref:hypothetical protein n=1 Tax=Uniformispora flossi TaxID=3390723 RepID=UPI003C2C13E0
MADSRPRDNHPPASLVQLPDSRQLWGELLVRRAPLAVAAIIAVALFASGCTDDDTKPDGKASSSTAPTSAPATIQAATTPTGNAPAASTITASTPGKTPAATGVPPKPDAATQAKYIAALNAIDPAIVSGKEDKAVSRGRDQCTSIGQDPKDRAKLVGLANQRFTAPTHPDGFGAATAEKILDVVHQYICPTY